MNVQRMSHRHIELLSHLWSWDHTVKWCWFISNYLSLSCVYLWRTFEANEVLTSKVNLSPKHCLSPTVNSNWKHVNLTPMKRSHFSFIQKSKGNWPIDTQRIKHRRSYSLWKKAPEENTCLTYCRTSSSLSQSLIRSTNHLAFQVVTELFKIFMCFI